MSLTRLITKESGAAIIHIINRFGGREKYVEDVQGPVVIPGFLESPHIKGWRSVFKGCPIPTNSKIFQYNTRTDISTSGEQLADYLKLQSKKQKKQLQLIGYSLGGLVARCAIQMFGAHEYVDTVITIASPHNGTHAARIGKYIFKSCEQMSPDSEFLKKLNSLSLPNHTKYKNLYPGFDELCFPIEYRRWNHPDVKNIKINEAQGHAHILTCKETWDIIKNPTQSKFL